MNILFLCVANSSRSQMAEGFAKALFGHKARIESAGSNPTRLNPAAVLVMAEAGVDITQNKSKAISDLPSDFTDRIDYVISLCAEEICPAELFPKAARLDWSMPDPAAKDDAAAFRATRDQIRERVRDLGRILDLI